MPRFERARKPEQKELRRRAILVAARKLARESGPIELSLNELGRRSGVSKPNIYRYFESREHILFQLYLDEMTEMVEAIESRLQEEPAPLEVTAVARVLAEEHLRRPLLCQLAGMASAILEHNMSADAIAAVKVGFAELLPRAIVALRRALPWLSEEDAFMVVQSMELQLAALWPMANPSKAAREVLARPEFSRMCTDANRDFPRFIEVILEGLRASPVRGGAGFIPLPPLHITSEA
ncbi:MAG: TetR family transcriptional regulator [Myxococcaceae bacterium]